MEGLKESQSSNSHAVHQSHTFYHRSPQQDEVTDDTGADLQDATDGIASIVFTEEEDSGCFGTRAIHG